MANVLVLEVGNERCAFAAIWPKSCWTCAFDSTFTLTCPPLITLKNVNPGLKKKSAWWGAMALASQACLHCFNGSLHEDAGEYYIPTQWRMGQVAQDMPETDQSATDFVVDGDTPAGSPVGSHRI
jgi:hypothetical protein